MKPGWFKMPLAPAAPWLRLSAVVRMLGRELFCMWQDGVIAGVSLDQIENVALRALMPDPRERKALRAAVQVMLEHGLIVAVEGGVRLLFSADAYADHRRMVDASSTDGLPKVDVRSTDGRQTPQDKPAESLSTAFHKIDRKKIDFQEREGDAFGAQRMSLHFRRRYLETRSTEPSMGGKNLGDFAERVKNTAAAQHMDPEALFAAALETWLRKPHGEVEQRAPYAAFAQAWGELTGSSRPRNGAAVRGLNAPEDV